MRPSKFGTGDQFVLDIAKKTNLPCFLLLNKIDTLHKERLLPLIAQYKELHEFAEVIPISALKEKGLDTLLDAIVKALPEGPRLFSQGPDYRPAGALPGGGVDSRAGAAIHRRRKFRTPPRC